MDWIDRKWNEADVMAELVHRLKLAGENVRCEVKLPSSGHRSGSMRVDVVVIRGDEIAFVIEVKEKMPVTRMKKGPHRQERAYREIEDLGVQVLWVRGKDGIESAIAHITDRPERRAA